MDGPDVGASDVGSSEGTGDGDAEGRREGAEVAINGKTGSAGGLGAANNSLRSKLLRPLCCAGLQRGL
eukprot:gene237-245_t